MNRETIIIITIAISWLASAFIDAIDFGGPQHRSLKELWHLGKGLAFGLPYAVLIILTVDKWLPFLIIMPFILFFIHEVSYRIFRGLGVWRLDEETNIPIVRYLWLIKRED